MEVNFNNLRRQAAYSVDRLIEKLNDSVIDGEVVVAVEDIKDKVNELRFYIMDIASIYNKGNEDFKDVGKDLNIAWFQLNEEEQGE